MAQAFKVAFKALGDKIAGTAKEIRSLVTSDPELRDEAYAQLDQAHAEPEGAALDAEQRRNG